MRGENSENMRGGEMEKGIKVAFTCYPLLLFFTHDEVEEKKPYLCEVCLLGQCEASSLRHDLKQYVIDAARSLHSSLDEDEISEVRATLPLLLFFSFPYFRLVFVILFFGCASFSLIF
jgi:hypothetical protein